MNLLRRHHAPIATESWKLIDDQAREMLAANLSARKLVAVSGPHGWEMAAVNTGRLDPGRVNNGDGVFYGVRKVLPLVEVRVPFTLDLWELDNVVRGARDPELGPLVEAAGKLAAFEEQAIYHGMPSAGITGLRQATQHPIQTLPADPTQWAEVVAHACVLLTVAGMAKPYAFVASPEVFRAIEQDSGQYPTRKQIESLINGKVILAPYIEGAFLLPADAEHEFELVLGQDVSIGFEEHHGHQVNLYLTESFTFQALEPRAVVAFQSARGSAAAKERAAGQAPSAAGSITG